MKKEKYSRPVMNVIYLLTSEGLLAGSELTVDSSIQTNTMLSKRQEVWNSDNWNNTYSEEEDY